MSPDILVDVLERAVRRGATAADGFLVEDRHFSGQVRLGQVDTVTHADDRHLSLRVFSGQASAAASTSYLSRESLERLVDEATTLARITTADPHAGLPDPAQLVEHMPDLDLADPTGHDFAPEEKLELARRAEAAAMAEDPRITKSEGAKFYDRQARYAYATSHGFLREYATSTFQLSATPVATRDGEMQRDSWYSTTRKRARLDDPESIGRTAARRTVRRLGGRKVKTTEVPVIFDPENAASLLRAIAGAASGPALYRRASFLLDRLGTRVAAPSVTLVDDGTLSGQLGSRPFDGEGLPTRRTVIVQDGKLESYLLDSYSGRKLGMRSTHHAVRDGVGVSVSTSNLMLLPGTASPEELIASVRNGFYVTELIGFGVNGVTGDYSRGAAGLWIENGELAYPVEEVTVAGNLLTMFDAVEGIGNDLVLRDRTVSPTLLIGKMVVAGN